VKMCIFKALKANCVKLWHTSFLGVLKDAEPKSAINLTFFCIKHEFQVASLHFI